MLLLRKQYPKDHIILATSYSVITHLLLYPWISNTFLACFLTRLGLKWVKVKLYLEWLKVKHHFLLIWVIPDIKWKPCSVLKSAYRYSIIRLVLTKYSLNDKFPPPSLGDFRSDKNIDQSTPHLTLDPFLDQSCHPPPIPTEICPQTQKFNKNNNNIVLHHSNYIET